MHTVVWLISFCFYKAYYNNVEKVTEVDRYILDKSTELQYHANVLQ